MEVDSQINVILKERLERDKIGKTFKIDFPLTDAQLPHILSCLRNQMKLDMECHKELLKQTVAHLIRQSNIQRLSLKSSEKVFIVGDLHGQFYDMLQIFKQSGFPSTTNKYVFNGDLVDRGSWSCEILILLFSVMLVRHNSVYINRGNHECHNMSSVYGFQKELAYKYSLSLVEYYLKVFYTMPLGTLLILPKHSVRTKKIMDVLCDRRMSFVYDKENNLVEPMMLQKRLSKSVCSDGPESMQGLTQHQSDASSLRASEDELAEEIIQVNKTDDKPSEKRESTIKIGPRIIIFHGGLPLPVTETVCKSHTNSKGVVVQKQQKVSKPVSLDKINSIKRFVEPDDNTDQIITQILWADPIDHKGTTMSERSFSMNFGPDITQGFLDRNKLSYVIRSHEVVDGHVVHKAHNGRLITLFSAPDAIEEGSNAGEYVEFDGSQLVFFPDKWNYIQIRRTKPPRPLWQDEDRGCSVM